MPYGIVQKIRDDTSQRVGVTRGPRRTANNLHSGLRILLRDQRTELDRLRA